MIARDLRCTRCANGTAQVRATGVLDRGPLRGRRVTEQFCGYDKCFALSRIVPGATVGWLYVETVEAL